MISRREFLAAIGVTSAAFMVPPELAAASPEARAQFDIGALQVGDRIEITLTNNGTTTATVTGMEIREDAVTVKLQSPPVLNPWAFNDWHPGGISSITVRSLGAR